MGFALVAAGLALVVGWRFLARLSDPPTLATVASTVPLARRASETVTIDSAPVVVPVPVPVPVPKASVPTPVPAKLRAAPAASAAPRASAIVKAPSAAPPAPTGDIFGGRY